MKRYIAWGLLTQIWWYIFFAYVDFIFAIFIIKRIYFSIHIISCYLWDGKCVAKIKIIDFENSTNDTDASTKFSLNKNVLT